MELLSISVNVVILNSGREENGQTLVGRLMPSPALFLPTNIFSGVLENVAVHLPGFCSVSWVVSSSSHHSHHPSPLLAQLWPQFHCAHCIASSSDMASLLASFSGCLTHSFIHLFTNKHVLSSYYVPGSLLGPGDAAVSEENRQNACPSLSTYTPASSSSVSAVCQGSPSFVG